MAKGIFVEITGRARMGKGGKNNSLDKMVGYPVQFGFIAGPCLFFWVN